MSTRKFARQIGVDDVLLDVDHVIDAGLGLHVLDRLVVHLVPGGGLDLDLDPGLLLELGREHVLDVVRRRRALGHAVQRHALEFRAGVRPEVGTGRHAAPATSPTASAAGWPSTESPFFPPCFRSRSVARPGRSSDPCCDLWLTLCLEVRASEYFRCMRCRHICNIEAARRGFAPPGRSSGWPLEALDDSDAFVSEVCWHYYVNEMTQAQVASLLGVTRLRVNQAIQKAKALGMVKVQIESPFLARVRASGEAPRPPRHSQGRWSRPPGATSTTTTVPPAPRLPTTSWSACAPGRGRRSASRGA